MRAMLELWYSLGGPSKPSAFHSLTFRLFRGGEMESVRPPRRLAGRAWQAGSVGFAAVGAERASIEGFGTIRRFSRLFRVRERRVFSSSQHLTFHSTDRTRSVHDFKFELTRCGLILLIFNVSTYCPKHRYSKWKLNENVLVVDRERILRRSSPVLVNPQRILRTNLPIEFRKM